MPVRIHECVYVFKCTYMCLQVEAQGWHCVSSSMIYSLLSYKLSQDL